MSGQGVPGWAGSEDMQGPAAPGGCQGLLWKVRCGGLTERGGQQRRSNSPRRPSSRSPSSASAPAPVHPPRHPLTLRSPAGWAEVLLGCAVQARVQPSLTHSSPCLGWCRGAGSALRTPSSRGSCAGEMWIQGLWVEGGT